MREGRKMLDAMSSDEYEELYLASVRVPLVLAIFLGLWGLVILVLQALQIDFSSVLRKASGKWMGWFSWGAESLPALPCSQYCHAHMSREQSWKTPRVFSQRSTAVCGPWYLLLYLVQPFPSAPL